MRWPGAGLTMMAALAAAEARAEHARITLDAEAAGETRSATVDQSPPAWGKNPRPVLKVRAGEPIRIQWMLVNAYPHKTLEDVVVHAFLAKEARAGQRELPDLRGDVVMESAFDMDFRPGGKAGQRLTVRIEEPGAYLLRVETGRTKSDHEHFAAIDVVVEPATP